MQARPLDLADAFEIIPDQHRDERGVFLEWFRCDRLRDVIGHTTHVAQANLSISARGAIRGLHLTRTPPGQSKYITCVRGAILDVLVDLRIGSPTFRQHETVPLDDSGRHMVYVPAGFGHGFCALTDDATVTYLCSSLYDRDRECVINPLDPELGIEWPIPDRIPSSSAVSGPGLLDCIANGLLPTYDDCRRLAAE